MYTATLWLSEDQAKAADRVLALKGPCPPTYFGDLDRKLAFAVGCNLVDHHQLEMRGYGGRDDRWLFELSVVQTSDRPERVVNIFNDETPAGTRTHVMRRDDGDAHSICGRYSCYNIGFEAKVQVTVVMYESDEHLSDIITNCRELLRLYNQATHDAFHDSVGDLHAALQNAGIDIDGMLAAEADQWHNAAPKELAHLLEKCGIEVLDLQVINHHAMECGLAVTIPRRPKFLVQASYAMPNSVLNGRVPVYYTFHGEPAHDPGGGPKEEASKRYPFDDGF